MMPVMDGIETLTAMLGKDRQLPVIVILNTAYPQYREMTWGAEAYIIKSSDLSELKRKIREVLEKREKLEGSSVPTSEDHQKKLKSRPLLAEQTGEF
jgi:DNA-binding NarL/FixJ family response regulator